MPRPRPAFECLLLLGGNVGDRARRLAEAVYALDRLPGTEVLSKSRLYETSPVGPSRRPYLNLAVRLRTSLSAMGLLVEGKRLEAAAGRRPGRRWGARPLDVDILSYGRARVRTRWLSIPHPRVARRSFALAPLADVAPGWKPRGTATVSALLARLNPDPLTVRIFHHG